MHALDRRAALADSGGATFHRAGAHVARGKDTWLACLQRPGRAAYTLPRRRAKDRMAGFDEAFFIALDLRREPGGAWHCADQGKDGRRLHGPPFVRLVV